MRGILSRGLLAVSVMSLVACGDDGPSQTHNVKIDVGGAVVYALDATEPLAGVTISIVDVEGTARTATTNSAGLWTIENILPGVYTESYTLAGYDTMNGTFSIPAGGENNVKNVFISRPTVLLAEPRPTVTVTTPFATALEPGDPMYDGLGGVTMVYSTSGNGDVVVTFDRRVVNGTVRIIDGLTGQQVFATTDSARMIWVITEAQIMNINGGITPANPGIRTDTDPYTWSRLFILGVTSYTPIHGDLVALPQTDAYFNVTQ